MDAKQSKYINEQIKLRYQTEDTESLAKALGISVYNLQKRASRMQIRKGTKANKIIDGKKLCCVCGQFKDAYTEYRIDRYQPNNLDYRCKECRKKMEKKEIDKEPVIVLRNGRWAFHRKRTMNIPVDGMLKCRGFCKKWKYLETDYTIDKAMSHGHSNYCKSCKHELYEINKKYSQEITIKQQHEEEK